MAFLKRSSRFILNHRKNYGFHRTDPALRLPPRGNGCSFAHSWNQHAMYSRWISAGMSLNNQIDKLISISGDRKRLFSKAAVSTSQAKITIGPPKTEESEKNVVYYGPISDTIKKVKLLSLSTCCLSVSLGPVITFLTSPDLNIIVKAAVASSVMFFSASTTAALHWFASPYVHKMRWKPGSDSFEVEVMTWLATYVPRTIYFSEVKAADTKRPYVTFQANGKYYYIDTERFKNKSLLARLLPSERPAFSTSRKS